MPKPTHEQRQRQMEGLRRWHASRSEEEKRITAIKGRLTRQKNGGYTPPGRLTARSWEYGDDPLEDL
jgi:hypothetical protein